MMAVTKLLMGIALILLAASTQGSAEQDPNCTSTGNPIFTVGYSIQLPNGNCSSANTTIPSPVYLDLPCGENAQTLMEKAVDADASYYFTVTYYGSQEGYDVKAISGIENEGNCSWHLYYQGPEDDEPDFVGVNVTLFIIPSNSSDVVMRYDYEPVAVPTPVPSPTPTPEPEPPTEDDGASPLGEHNRVLVVASIFFALMLFI